VAHARGRLEVIRGAMFAGKTTELIRRLEEARASGRSVAAIKPVTDDRYSADELVTHDGQRWKARGMSHPKQLARLAGDADVVGLDEAHFFEPTLAGMCRALADRPTRVIVAGVYLDHRGRPFDTVEQLARQADHVTELFARCAVCGSRAMHSQRMFEGEARIVVGGAGMYEPRCAKCFEPPA
jgi:thymidine kinase